MKIGNMEAVREKFIDMYLNTWIIHSSVKFTNHILDSGTTPSVITAIMKQQTTERSRVILNHGMDIYSGSGICVGDNNFFTKFYNSAPVGITVEGSNTLTRGLIIFGQGLNKSHPYIFPIFQSIQTDDQQMFRNNFNLLVKDLACNYSSLLNPWNMIPKTPQQQLEHLTLKFSVLANFIAVMGGKIKSNQMISGYMADVLSNIYLGYSLVWYHHHHLPNHKLKDYSIDFLNREIEHKMNLLINNYPLPLLKPLLFPLSNPVRYSNLQDNNKIYSIIKDDQQIYNLLKDDIYAENTVLEKMEKLRTLDEKSADYHNLYQNIISVGEFNIEK
jgi:acyl-CoA dehydrogenase